METPGCPQSSSIPLEESWSCPGLVNSFTSPDKGSVPLHCCCPALSEQECEAIGSWLVSQEWGSFLGLLPFQAHLYEQAVSHRE